MRNQKAFTLIELLLVISIIALLSSIVLSSLGEARNKAKLAALKENIISLRNEGEIYYTTNNRYVNPDNGGAENANCPSDVDASFGFLGSTKGVEIINAMKEMGNTTEAKCWIKPSSWVVVLGTQNINLAKNNSNVAYAAVDGKLCFDSSKNIVAVNLDNGSADSSSDYENLDYESSVDISGEIWVCN